MHAAREGGDTTGGECGRTLQVGYIATVSLPQLAWKIHKVFQKLWKVSCRQVDGLRMRIAGKSIPTEKFAAKKAQRYNSPTPAKLPVPALVRKSHSHSFSSSGWSAPTSNICPPSRQEMMYVWNGFTVVGKRPSLTQNIFAMLDEADEQLRNDPSKISFKTFCPTHFCAQLWIYQLVIPHSDPTEYHLDDQCVIQLLKGLCLRHLGRLVQAEHCFNHVIARWGHQNSHHLTHPKKKTHTLHWRSFFLSRCTCEKRCIMTIKGILFYTHTHMHEINIS